MSVIAVVILLFTVLFFLILWKTLNRKRAMPLPPMASGGLPIVGHTLLVLCNRNRLYEILVNTILRPSLKKGLEVVTVRIGTWDIYVVTNPDDCYLVANSCLTKDVVYKFFKPAFGDAELLTADVPIWKKHRKLLNPTFNQAVLDTYLSEFNHQSRVLVKNLELKAGMKSFDQMLSVTHTILEIVCATIMGVGVEDEDLKKQFAKAIEIFTDCMVERIRKFWYHNDFLFSFSNLKKRQDSATKAFLKVSYEVLRTKKTKLYRKEKADECEDMTKPRFKSFLDLLLDLSKQGALKESEIHEEVNTFIGAATDTTSYTLGITLLIIGSYPEVQQKVFNELHEVFQGSDRDVEKQDLSELKYLEAVIKETMRLYPAIVTLGRTVDRELNFKNCSIPAGSRCFVSIYNVGRHPVWGPDAEQFRPERWLDGSLPTNPRAFAVFGLGRRSCIGLNFAMMLVKTVLAHVVRRYRISGDVTQLVQNVDVVSRMVSGHHISIQQRNILAKEVSKGN